jgi:hypothetical protein
MTEQKIEAFWRDATAADVAKVMRGEKVEARFRDEDAEDWQDCLLAGWRISRYYPGVFWLDLDEITWKQCQVYDPPQWWLDKPDPGEGYRLLDPFTDEQPELGDCMFDRIDKKWISLVPNFLPGRRPSVWYRRRIEPNVPEIPDSSRSKDYIPSGWVKLSDDEPRLASDAYWSQGASEWCLIGEDRVNFANRSKWPAIRQAFNQMRTLLVADCCYCLPNGQKIRTTEKGFEVL